MSTLYEDTPLHIDASTNIRLLTILPTNDETTPIACALHVVALRENPHYTALSYVWGPPTPSRDIFVNGKPFTVRENLWNFLNQARKEEKNCPFWIDAICIDQDSNPERTHQVSMMGKIYSEAQLVLVWLGNSTKHTARWRTLFSTLLAFDILKLAEQEAWWEDNLECIKELYCSPYWSRIWIVQEYVLGKMISIRCGSHGITHDEMRGIRDQYFYIHSHKDDLCMILDSPATRVQRLRDNNLSIRDRGKEFTLIFESVILEFADSGCADVRDHVYALLALCDGPLIIPDYSKSPLELFVQILRRADDTSLEGGRLPYEDERVRTIEYLGEVRELLGIEDEELEKLDCETTELLYRWSFDCSTSGTSCTNSH